MKIALGTVQFGLDYGVANRTGQVSKNQIELILDLARQRGVDTIDTAIAYGESESVLGSIGVSDFKLLTKLPAVPNDCRDVSAWVHDQCLGSLGRMKVDSVYGLLLHKSQDLIGPRGCDLNQALQGLKANGLVKKVGISIYSPTELEAIMPLYDIDLIQAPLNLIDRRISSSGWLQKLHAAGVEVHARSVFLQGLLLMDQQSIPPKFSQWNYLLKIWHDWLNKSSISASQACLTFAQGFSEISRVVIGVDSISQFDHLMNVAEQTTDFDFPQISCVNELLINPANWNSL